MKNFIWSIVNFDVIWLIAIIVATFFVWKKNYIIGSRILYAFVVVGMIIIVTPLPEWGMTFIENRFSPLKTIPNNVKGVIVIGGIVDRRVSKQRGRPSYNMFGARMVPLLKLMSQHPEYTYIIMGGGRPYHPNFQEADILVRYLDYVKPKLANLLSDNKSSTTVESARVSYNMVKPKPGEKWLLLTSAYHMPRAVGVFKKAGWDIIPYPVDYKTSGKYYMRINFSLWWGFMMWSISSYELLMNVLSYFNGESYTLLPSERDA